MQATRHTNNFYYFIGLGSEEAWRQKRKNDSLCVKGTQESAKRDHSDQNRNKVSDATYFWVE